MIKIKQNNSGILRLKISIIYHVLNLKISLRSQLRTDKSHKMVHPSSGPFETHQYSPKETIPSDLYWLVKSGNTENQGRVTCQSFAGLTDFHYWFKLSYSRINLLVWIVWLINLIPVCYPILIQSESGYIWQGQFTCLEYFSSLQAFYFLSVTLKK